MLALSFKKRPDGLTAQGGNAEVVNVEATPAQNLSRFVNRQLSQSDRPELTQAKVIVSGGRIGFGASGRSGGQVISDFACGMEEIEKQVGLERTILYSLNESTL